ncbi:MAG TPA: PP2C family protein-serine/threonine phosphatase [Vicinamibacterales bacterium]|nr:PP2C family protein-serine/threonine phosphatase [Vicinamibacterales bacterium]
MSPRLRDFVSTYTRDLKAEDLQRLFTRDAREAYQFFARTIDAKELEGLPWHRRLLVQLRLFFIAFTMKLSPARRIVYAASIIFAVVGVFNLMQLQLRLGQVSVGRVNAVVPYTVMPNGLLSLVVAFVLVNLIVLLEVADRLTLKNDLEIAREIQKAMLPPGRFRAPGADVAGFSRPANTVGGDFYEILPLSDGRLVMAVGDVAGKGSPASLLMALLLAMMRTLTDEHLDAAELIARLNVQVCRQSPGNRFITLFYSVLDLASGELRYVNAGHTPPLLLRARGGVEHLASGGVALGMFEGSAFDTGRVLLQPDDLLAIYSDGITEAENPAGQPFDESGLETVLAAERRNNVAAACAAVARAVERYTADTRVADDLTLLVLRRSAVPQPAGV